MGKMYSRDKTKKFQAATHVITAIDRLTLSNFSHCVPSWRLIECPQLDKNWVISTEDFCVGTKPEISINHGRKTWKTIRLFVSSTFKDMFCERDYLVKKVFPLLRDWCEEQKIRLIECDLRWGVPKDADSREVLLQCLSEIDRCYEENEHPYFLSLLSERYGWVPEDSEVPEDIKNKYKYLRGLSVTAWEVMTGAFWDYNPNAFFCCRDPVSLKALNNNSDFFEDDEGSIESLKRLKEMIKKRFPDQQIDYTCSVSSDGKSGKDLENFGEHVLDFFKHAISRQYPSDHIYDEMTSVEQEREEHAMFLLQRSLVMLGRDEKIEMINNYVYGKSPEPLVLVGQPGSGKSALIAYCAKCSEKNPENKTFYHFIGATSGSTDLFRLLSRLWQESVPEEQLPSNVDEMKYMMESMLSRAAFSSHCERKRRIVIFIDALNQLNDESDAHKLVWLPRKLPDTVRIIVSTLAGKSLDSLRNHPVKCPEVDVNPLDDETRQEIVTNVLAEYNKKLDSNQLTNLVKKTEAGRPLYLMIACEELRVFGIFSKLDQKINDLASDLLGLLKQVLHRIVDEHGKYLVIAILCLMETSHFGLLETELLDLLVLSPTTPSSPHHTSEYSKLPMAQWVSVYIALKPFIRPCGSSGEGRLDFYHRTISKVVRSEYLTSESDVIWWHLRLADYFGNCKDIERKTEELPFHLDVVGETDRLTKCITDIHVFNQLNKEDTKPLLLYYCRQIGGYKVAGEHFITAFKQYKEKMSELTEDELVALDTTLACFLSEIGEYTPAEEIFRSHIDRVYRENAVLDAKYMDALLGLETLYFKQAIMVVYGTHPMFAYCRQMGAEYCNSCFQTHKAHLSSDDLQLGKVAVILAYFNKSYISIAEPIFEKHNYKKGLVEVYCMLGQMNAGKAQTDMNIPTTYLQKAVDLAESQLGKYHLSTARAYQLFGQMYWNSWTYGKFTKDCMPLLLTYYQEELEILEELLGSDHPTVIRSREDCIIVLGQVGDPDSLKLANELRKLQPASNNAIQR